MYKLKNELIFQEIEIQVMYIWHHDTTIGIYCVQQHDEQSFHGDVKVAKQCTHKEIEVV